MLSGYIHPLLLGGGKYMTPTITECVLGKIFNTVLYDRIDNYPDRIYKEDKNL